MSTGVAEETSGINIYRPRTTSPEIVLNNTVLKVTKL